MDLTGHGLSADGVGRGAARLRFAPSLGFAAGKTQQKQTACVEERPCGVRINRYESLQRTSVRSCRYYEDQNLDYITK